MHPAKSVIFFTTASGAGYGLIVWLGLLGAFGLVPANTVFGFTAFAVALVLIVGGLMSSTFHLGHPERAWRAFSQWRTSWLSREGVAAVLAFAPIGAYGISWVFLGRNTGWAGAFGLISAVMALITVYCTSMIYAALKTIPAWSNHWTPTAYLTLSLSTGGVLAALLFAVWGFDINSAWVFVVAALTGLSLLIKVAYWRSIDSAAATSTAESATGLGEFGKVRLIDAPHTQSNYLLEEMGFQIARKHAAKLRDVAIIAGFILPILLLLTAGLTSLPLIPLCTLAALAAAVGIVVERWLFFAEAKHAVMLYYGESRV